MRRAGVRAMESEVLRSGEVRAGGAGEIAGAQLDDVAEEEEVRAGTAGWGGERDLELGPGLDVGGTGGAEEGGEAGVELDDAVDGVEGGPGTAGMGGAGEEGCIARVDESDRWWAGCEQYRDGLAPSGR